MIRVGINQFCLKDSIDNRYYIESNLFLIIIKKSQKISISNQLLMLPSYIQDPKSEFFCYSFIKTIPQSIIGFCLLLFTLILLITAIVHYRRAARVNMLGGPVKYIYIGLFLWAAFYLIKIIQSQLIYWIQISRPNDKTDEVDRNYSMATKYLFCIDIIGVFIIQMLLILICYNWMSNVISIFEQLMQMDNDEKATQIIKNYLRFQQICKQLLRIYLSARMLFFGIAIAFIVVRDRETQNILLQTILILLLFEAFVVLVILGLSIHAIRKNDKLAQLVNEDQIQDMIKKYIILFLCSLTRFAVDSVFVYYNFYTLTNKTTCYATKDEETTAVSLLYITLQGLLTHCLPVYVILRIYRVQQKNIDLTESLLAAEQFTGSTKDANIATN